MRDPRDVVGPVYGLYGHVWDSIHSRPYGSRIESVQTGFRATAAALEGRTAELDAFDLLVARSKDRNYDRGMILSGLRGVGKTTLLTTLAEHADRQGWPTIGIEARPNDAGVAAVRARLSQELTVGQRR
ncbi:MAG TPA: ATP-binding protein [Aldersonia sp.]